MSIAEIKQKIIPVLEEYGVDYAGVFGSVARGEELAESDVDILVTLEQPIGVYKFMELQEKLENVIGRDVDLVSKSAVNKYIEPYITHDLVTLYEKG